MFDPFDPQTWHDIDEPPSEEAPAPEGESWIFDLETGPQSFDGPFAKAVAELAQADALPIMLGYWPQPGPVDATTHTFTLMSLALARAVREGYLPETEEWENTILDLLEMELHIVIKGEILNLFLPQKTRQQVLRAGGREI